MNLFSKLHKKPTAIAFVDFEHWYISMTKLHGTPPDVRRWFSQIQKLYTVKEIAFFADFTGSLEACLDDIRAITNIVIDTHNAGAHYKKDFTDFIMLDYIYRKSIAKPRVDTYILFTGDSHFSSVVNFLRKDRRKKVVLYGVKNATARLLKDSVDAFVELPTEEDILAQYEQAVLQHFARLRKEKKHRMLPTTRTVVSTVCANTKFSAEDITAAVERLKEAGYLQSKALPEQYRHTRSRRPLRYLEPDWEKIEKEQRI